MMSELFETAQTRHRTAKPWLASAIAHGALLCLIALRSSGGEELGPPEPVADAPSQQIVWLSEAGPGGGGGGGGSRSPQPASQARIPGRDALTVPVAPSPSQTVTEEIKPDAVQTLEIPARSLAAADLEINGVLETAPPGMSRGSGAGPGAGSGKGSGIGSGDGAGLGDGHGRGTGGGIYQPGNDVTLPTPVYRAEPRYTTAAMRARIQGAVRVECVVDINGVCSRPRLIRSLDSTYGLDEQALLAAARWKFLPGTRFGEPVPVVITIELGFTIH
jgi:periplasmic protein TonB